VIARQATLANRCGKFLQRNLPWMFLLEALAGLQARGGISRRDLATATADQPAGRSGG
jgi:hypothetical protein